MKPLLELPSQVALRRLFDYCATTGILSWRVGRQGAGRGKRAGSMRGEYRQVKIDGQRYAEHRLIWVWMTGETPPADIDHRNGCKSDNRFDNLRSTTRQTNSENLRKPTRRNKVGALGVSVDTATGLFRATIKTHGKTRSLGRFATVEEASLVYLNAKRQLHMGCTL